MATMKLNSLNDNCQKYACILFVHSGANSHINT